MSSCCAFLKFYFLEDENHNAFSYLCPLDLKKTINVPRKQKNKN